MKRHREQSQALPQAFLDRLTAQFGQAGMLRVVAGCRAKRMRTLRVNTLRTNDEDVMEVLRHEQIQFERVKEIPHAFIIKNRTSKELLAHPLCTSGKVYLQGLASMIPPLLFDAEEIGGKTVLDLCAAPGSKTTQLAALTNNMAEIIACEENAIRFAKLKHTVDMQGARVDVRHTDATLFHHEMPQTFDAVLADVPCSAEGRIDTSDPRTYKFWSQKNITEHAKLQRRLLRSAVGCLKPGGTIVYSTCTLAKEENQEMIGWLLNEFPRLQAVPITLPFPNVIKTANKTLTLLPTDRMEGFFVAKLKKSSNA